MKAVRQIDVQRISAQVTSPTPSFKFATLTLNPRLQKHPANKQFSITIAHFISVLQTFNEDYSYVTELTQNGNVHYHFWFVDKYKNSMREMMDTFKQIQLFGFMCISRDNVNKSTLQKQEDTYAYMLKDIEGTYKLVRSRNMTGNRQVVIDINKDDYDTHELDITLN